MCHFSTEGNLVVVTLQTGAQPVIYELPFSMGNQFSTDYSARVGRILMILSADYAHSQFWPKFASVFLPALLCYIGTTPLIRVRKSKNFPDSKILSHKTFPDIMRKLCQFSNSRQICVKSVFANFKQKQKHGPNMLYRVHI